jgi:3-oxoacyl-[acyl-carrier protein] reductase
MRELASSLDRVSPDATLPQGKGGGRVAFHVSEQLVNRFAALTGDRSELHVDDVMARRTAYRRRVVHGMLPVGFLAASAPFQVEGFRCRPVALSGRFLAPVFAGDRLVVTTEAGRKGSSGEHVSFDFRIENAASGATVTTGEVTLAYHGPAPNASDDDAAGAPLLTRPLKMSTMQLEEIEVGMTERLDFRVSRASVRQFGDIIAEGVDRGDAAELLERVDVPSLLSVLLFSTSVGVALPGTNATFLEFSARVEQPVRVGASYALEGEVVHRSRGTRIVKKQLVARDVETREIAIRGKVAALANTVAARMPSIGELREIGTDPGLDGKVVLITGASRGIGETTAKLVALCGAKVIVNYHRGAADADRVVREIEESGGSALAVGADVTNEGDVRALVERSVERFGAVDVLVNNAVRDFRPIPFAQLTWDEVQRDLDVIAKGAFLCCQHVIPAMIAQGGGKIINIASVATDNPPPDQTKYVMAKSALVGLTRSLAVELASKNIQVNMVVPSFVETDLVAHVQEGFRNKIARETPMGRNASPVDVARAVLFLASSWSSFTTGQKLMVTGGGAPYL